MSGEFSNGGLIGGPADPDPDFLARMEAHDWGHSISAAQVRKLGTEFLEALNNAVLPRREPA